jgi:hypothetical protein
VQSYGTVTVTFASPAIEPLKVDLTCEWSTPTEVSAFYLTDPVPLQGEDVSFALFPQAADSGLFRIGRDGAAGYDATPVRGDVRLVSSSPDLANGSIQFDDIAPDPETADPGPLPSPLADWIRPIGGDPQMASLTGAVDWACEPAPASVPTPAPSVSEAPAPIVPPLPALALVDGDRRELGVDGCGSSFDIDGHTGADSCGPSFQAPGDEHVVRVKAGSTLTFAIPTGWHFTRGEIGRVTWAEAVRWRGVLPDTYAKMRSIVPTTGPTVRVAAPPAGDWVIVVSWSAARGGDSISWPDYYRVVVSD